MAKKAVKGSKKSKLSKKAQPPVLNLKYTARMARPH
jgi:hypothetical protein